MLFATRGFRQGASSAKFGETPAEPEILSSFERSALTHEAMQQYQQGFWITSPEESERNSAMI